MGSIKQQVEWRFRKAQVAGSSPAGGLRQNPADIGVNGVFCKLRFLISFEISELCAMRPVLRRDSRHIRILAYYGSGLQYGGKLDRVEALCIVPILGTT